MKKMNKHTNATLEKKSKAVRQKLQKAKRASYVKMPS